MVDIPPKLNLQIITKLVLSYLLTQVFLTEVRWLCGHVGMNCSIQSSEAFTEVDMCLKVELVAETVIFVVRIVLRRAIHDQILTLDHDRR